jgi:ABC-type transporter Mla MlaB component
MEPRQTDAHRSVVCDLRGLAPVDLATVDALACLELAARRLGCSLSVVGASSELRELVSLAGLSDVLTLDDAASDS